MFLLANGSGPPLSGKELEMFAFEVQHVLHGVGAENHHRRRQARNTSSRLKWRGCRTDAEAKQIAKTIAESGW